MQWRWIVNDEGLFHDFRYPRDRPIADGYGENTHGRMVLYESKTKGKVKRALEQLEATMEWLMDKGYAVDHLGIQLDRFGHGEPWYQGQGGYLYPRGRLGAEPVRVKGLPVMVEQRV